MVLSDVYLFIEAVVVIENFDECTVDHVIGAVTFSFSIL